MNYFDIECPYCGAGQDINNYNDYHENITYQQECENCANYPRLYPRTS